MLARLEAVDTLFESAKARETGSIQLKYYWVRVHGLSSQSRGHRNNGGIGGRCENGTLRRFPDFLRRPVQPRSLIVQNARGNAHQPGINVVREYTYFVYPFLRATSLADELRLPLRQ